MLSLSLSRARSLARSHAHTACGPLQARELHEETGLIAAAGSLVPLLTGTDALFHNRRYFQLTVGDHSTVDGPDSGTKGVHSAATGEQGFRLRLSKVRGPRRCQPLHLSFARALSLFRSLPGYL